MEHLEAVLDAVFNGGFQAGLNISGGNPNTFKYTVGIWNAPDEFKPTINTAYDNLVDVLKVIPTYPNEVIVQIQPGDEKMAVVQIAIYAEAPVKAWIIPITEPTEEEVSDDSADSKMQNTD